MHKKSKNRRFYSEHIRMAQLLEKKSIGVHDELKYFSSIIFVYCPISMVYGWLDIFSGCEKKIIQIHDFHTQKTPERHCAN